MKYFYHQEIFLPTRCVSAEAARVQEDAAGADLPDLEHHAAQLRAVVRHLAHLLLRVRGPALGHRQTGRAHIQHSAIVFMAQLWPLGPLNLTLWPQSGSRGDTCSWSVTRRTRSYPAKIHVFLNSQQFCRV